MTKKAGKQALHRKAKLVERQIGAAADSEAPEAHLRPEHETPVQTGDVGGIADVVEGERRNGTEHDTEGGPDLPPGGERQSGSGSRNTAHCGEQNLLHHKGPADKRRCSLGRKDGNSSRLGTCKNASLFVSSRTCKSIDRERTDSESENKTSGEQVPSAVRAAGPDAGQRRDGGSDEDGAATAEEIVERRSEPASWLRRRKRRRFVELRD